MRKPRHVYRFPPGPKSLPIVGNLPEFRRDPTGFSKRLACDYGDAAHFKLGRRHVVQLNSPEFIRDVLVTNYRQFRKTHAFDFAEMIIGDGLLRSEGDFHLRQRRLIQPAFQQERMTRYALAVVQAAAEASQRWQPGQSVDMFDEMMRVTGVVGAKAFLSADLEADFDQIGRDLTTVFEYFQKLIVPFPRLMSMLPTPGRRRFEAARWRLDDTIYRVLCARRSADGKSDDMLGMLLAAQDEEGDGLGMSDKQVRDEAMTMFVASHETTATALTWIWCLLSQHPDVEAKMHLELDAALAGRAPAFADIERLSYTRMVIAESMRLYPPVWAITRRAMEDYAFGEWNVPAGTTIAMSQFVMHRDPRYYPDPERFDPLRWTEEETAKRPKYSYFPFGGGPRLCIGERFAWMEATLILATLCQTWEARLPSGFEPRLQPFMVLRRAGGMPMRLACRRETSEPRSATSLTLAANA